MIGSEKLHMEKLLLLLYAYPYPKLPLSLTNFLGNSFVILLSGLQL